MKTATASNPLRAFRGDAKIKAHYLKRVVAHRKADEIASGHYWENNGEGFTGCAVGCTLHSSDHNAYETELGIPKILARLEDRLFEALWTRDNEFAKMWPEKFLKAAKPGADLTLVWPKFALWLLADAKDGVIRFAKTEKTRAAIFDVAALYQRWVGGDKPPTTEWESARKIAYAADAAASAYAAASAAYADAYAASAAASAAYAAADAAYADAYASAAASAAYADAAYAAYAAASAAYAAAYAASAAYAAARKAHYLLMANKLLELMKEAK